MRYAIGVDLGGTHLRVALVDKKGTILNKETIEVYAFKELDPFFKKLVSSIKAIAGDHLPKLAGIGLGLPGICNQKEGVVHELPHFPDWKDIPAIQMLKKDFFCPILLDNDANMAAIGEHWLGAAQSFSSFIMLTLGTGIGGGIFLNGKIWQGDEGFAGEVGHMTIEKDGRPCACGSRGCWETYAASQAVPKGKTAKALADAAEKSEKEALDFWKEFGRNLGIGIANLAKITGIENYVLGGNIANAVKYFLKACMEEIRGSTYAHLAQTIQIKTSTLDGNSSLLGAAQCVFEVSASS